MLLEFDKILLFFRNFISKFIEKFLKNGHLTFERIKTYYDKKNHIFLCLIDDHFYIFNACLCHGAWGG